MTVKDLDSNVKERIDEIFKDDFAVDEPEEESSSESGESYHSPGKKIQTERMRGGNYEAVDNIYKATRDVVRTQILRDTSKKKKASAKSS